MRSGAGGNEVIEKWHLICHESEVAVNGDYFAMRWTLHRDIAISNFDGEIVAWDNRCPHRGMFIHEDMHGNDSARVCKYHGRPAKRCDLRETYPVRVLNGWVFFFDTAPADWLRGGSWTPPFFTETPQLSLYKSIRYVYPCDWRVAIENILDCEHVTAVHPNSLNQLKLTHIKQQLHDDGSSTDMFESGIWSRLDKLGSHLPETPEFDGSGVDYIHTHFYPYAAISSTRGWTWSLQHYIPRSDGKTTFLHRLYRRFDVPQEFARAAFEVNCKTFAEDAEVVRRVPAGVYGALEKHESRLKHFRSQLMADAGHVL